MNRHRGQAFVESLTALLFLTPLLVCAVYLADLHRAGQGAALAAREIALATAHDPAGDVHPAVVRALQDLSIPADSTSGDRLEARLQRTDVSDAPRALESTVRIMLAPALALGSGDFDLPQWHGRTVNTGVSMGSTKVLDVPLDLPIVMQEQLFLFAGHGAASGPDQVRSRTAALSVAGSLAAAAQPIETVMSLASIVEPALSRLCIGRIDPDIVPEDRLSGPDSRPTDLRYQPC